MEKKFFVTDHTDHCMEDGIFFVYTTKNSASPQNRIEIALKKGIKKLIIEGNIKQYCIEKHFENEILQHLIDIEYCSSELIDQYFATLCALHNNNPEKKLKIIGITGTKGKTSTTIYLHTILRLLGKKSAVISTAYNQIASEKKEKTDFTTPKSDYIFEFLSKCVKNNIEYVVMEVSAQALSRKRVYGIEFEGVIFTNFSHEHGEFYQTQDDYFNAKFSIIKQIKKDGFLITANNEERIITALIKEKNNTIYVKTTGINNSPDCLIMIQENNFENIQGTIQIDSNFFNFKTYLHGVYNVYNCCYVFLALIEMKILNKNKEIENFFNLLQFLEPAEGRNEKYILDNKKYICIDRASTPSSFEAVLQTFRNQTNHLIIVFGCGGDRDKEKRPILAKLAELYGDEIFVTKDNPRTESLATIFHDIISGFTFNKPIHIYQDRKDAIKNAYLKAKEGTIIALLGKGGENYQIEGHEKIYFSEKEIIQSLLQKPTN